MAEDQKKEMPESFDAFPIVHESVIPSAAEPSESFDAFPVVEPTGSEKIGAFGKQVLGGAIESGAILSGMGAGAAIGALGGPLAPVTVPVGAAVGAGAGHFFGKGAKGLLDIPSVEALPEQLRPFGRAGEVVGGSIPFAGAPLAAARIGARLPASKVGNFINRIIDMAAESPGTFAAAETASIAGAATAGGIAEAFAPGEKGILFGAEVAGGFFNPTRFVAGASKLGMDGMRRTIQALSPSGRKTQAAKILSEIIENAGEDSTLVAKLLKDSGLPGTTSAQKTGSRALADLEAFLVKENAKFGIEAKEAAENSLSMLRDSMIALRGTGDPAALTAAAEMQASRFRMLLATRIQAAEKTAAEAAARITEDTPQARAEISRVARKALEGSLVDSRRTESKLWEAVAKEVPASAKGIVERFNALKSQMLPEEALPKIVEGFVERMAANKNRSTSGELIMFRSRALALARESDIQGKVNDARIYGELAEAALNDLDNMASTPVFGAYGRLAEGYDAARQFSRELNEIFTRTFAGQALETGRRGRAAVQPEIMLRRALASGEEAGAIRFKELEDAVRFLPAKGLGGEATGERVTAMLDAQERVFRLAAAESVDPNTGRVSANKLAKIIRDNGELLSKFPEVKTDLEFALKSETRLSEIGDAAKGLSRVAEQKAAFSRISKFENASDAVKSAVSPGNKTPLEDVNGLVRVAKRGGPKATEGLKAAVWEHAARHATSEAGEFSFEKLSAALFNPIRPGQPSLAEALSKEGIMSGKEISSAKTLIAEAEKIANVVSARTDIETLAIGTDALTDLVLRISGARLGTMFAGGATGPSLIAAGRGSSFARDVIGKIPQAKVQDVLIEAARDPKFMAMLLEKPKSPKDGLRLARQIHAYLFQAGLSTLPEDEESQ